MRLSQTWFWKPSVQVVGAVVDGQGIFHAVQGEFSLGDTVGKAPGNFPAARTVGHIIGRIFIADNYVLQLAVTVRHHNPDNGRADACELYIGAGSVFEGVQENVFSAGQGAP